MYQDLYLYQVFCWVVQEQHVHVVNSLVFLFFQQLSGYISVLSNLVLMTCPGHKKCRLISSVWKDFKPIYKEGKLVEAQCKYCDEIVVVALHVSTSNAHRHLASCKSRLGLHQIVDKLKASATSPHASMLNQWDFDQQTSNKLLAIMIVLHELPFSIVEYQGFRDFVKSLNPLYKMVSKVTIKNDCMVLHEDQRSALWEYFGRFDGRVSLTADMWTSNHTMGYLCITCHFIDNK